MKMYVYNNILAETNPCRGGQGSWMAEITLVIAKSIEVQQKNLI